MRIACLLCCAPVFVGPAHADSLYRPDARLASLFADRKAARVGDVLTVLILEQTSATHQDAQENSKTSKSEVGPGAGAISLIPLAGFDAKSETKADSSRRRTGSVRATVAVTVVGVTQQGNLLVEGRKTLRINRDTQIITLRGVVRPRDVGPNNTVLSSAIADAAILLSGSTPRRPHKRVGLVTRILNWLW
ncbi:MAG: flagellar basal body L-ring protein FlgH [Armatimonadota bacterium]